MINSDHWLNAIILLFEYINLQRKTNTIPLHTCTSYIQLCTYWFKMPMAFIIFVCDFCPQTNVSHTSLDNESSPECLKWGSDAIWGCFSFFQVCPTPCPNRPVWPASAVPVTASTRASPSTPQTSVSRPSLTFSIWKSAAHTTSLPVVPPWWNVNPRLLRASSWRILSPRNGTVPTALTLTK